MRASGCDVCLTPCVLAAARAPTRWKPRIHSRQVRRRPLLAVRTFLQCSPQLTHPFYTHMTGGRKVRVEMVSAHAASGCSTAIMSARARGGDKRHMSSYHRPTRGREDDSVAIRFAERLAAKTLKSLPRGVNELSQPWGLRLWTCGVPLPRDVHVKRRREDRVWLARRPWSGSRQAASPARLPCSLVARLTVALDQLLASVPVPSTRRMVAV